MDGRVPWKHGEASKENRWRNEGATWKGGWTNKKDGVRNAIDECTTSKSAEEGI